MTGKTHRVGGMLCCLTGYSVLQEKGMLLNNVNPMLQMAVMYPFAIYGSTVSDMDHNWDSAPSKDVFSWFIWRVLHLSTWIRKKFGEKKCKGLLKVFDAKHRSWQTHSDLFLILSVMLSIGLGNLCKGTANGVIISLIFQGLILGIISHLILDLLTPEGIWSFLLTAVKKLLGSKEKGLQHLRIVPNKGSFATSSDESPWERFIRKLMWLTCFILIFRLIYIYSPYRIDFVTGKF